MLGPACPPWSTAGFARPPPPPPATVRSPRPPSAPPAPRRSGGSTNALRPVTVHQLYTAYNVAAQAGGDLELDGETVERVTLVGKVRSISNAPAHCEVRLDDGTGITTVKQYKDDEDDAALQALQVGQYVRVHGQFRGLDDSGTVQGFKIRPVTDFNEVVFHSLEAVFAHEMLQARQKGVPTHAGVGAAAAPAAAAGGFGAAAPAAAGFGAPAATGNACMDACMVVFNTDAEAMGDQGLSVAQLKLKLQGRFDDGAIMQAVDALMQDAQIYSTIDDQHFKSTMH